MGNSYRVIRAQAKAADIDWPSLTDGKFARMSGSRMVGGDVGWGDVVDKPLAFTPTAHYHAIADVTGLQSALDEVSGGGLTQESADARYLQLTGGSIQPTAPTITPTVKLYSGRDWGDYSNYQDILQLWSRDGSVKLGVMDFIGRWAVNAGQVSGFGPSSIDASVLISTRTSDAPALYLHAFNNQNDVIYMRNNDGVRGFGAGINNLVLGGTSLTEYIQKFQLKSSTTYNRDAASIGIQWTDSTDATRTSKQVFSAVRNGTTYSVMEAGGADQSLTVGPEQLNRWVHFYDNQFGIGMDGDGNVRVKSANAIKLVGNSVSVTGAFSLTSGLQINGSFDMALLDNGHYKNSIINSYDGGTLSSNWMQFRVCDTTTLGQVIPLQINGERRVMMGAPNSAIADSILPNNTIAPELDEANGLLKIRIRKSDGTYATTELAYVND